jgi:uncharacterized coiled-coil DUF342 family protein
VEMGKLRFEQTQQSEKIIQLQKQLDNKDNELKRLRDELDELRKERDKLIMDKALRQNASKKANIWKIELNYCSPELMS